MMQPLETALAKARTRRRLPEPEARRRLRERLGISQEAVAQAVGASQAAISRWERGERTPRGHLLDKYLGILDRLMVEVAGRLQ